MPMVMSKVLHNSKLLEKLISNNPDPVSVKNIISLCKNGSEIQLMDIFKKISKGEYREENLALLFEQLDLKEISSMNFYARRKLCFGVKLNQIFNNESWTKENLSQFFDNPVKYLQNKVPTFPIHKLELVKILCLEEEIKNAETIESIRYGQDPETAMASEDVKAANLLFENTLAPYIEKKIQRESPKWGNSETCIDIIEKDLRGTLLDTIIEENKNNTEIIAFINKNREALKAGDDKELMDKARELFASATNEIEAVQIAWRAYDKFAPVKGGWPNLFTLSNEQNEIFAGTAAATSTVAFKEAVSEVRRRVAYSYLATMDEPGNLEFKSEGERQNYINNKDTRLFNIISKIAEIRRSHNEQLGDKTGVDDPSCYPGTIGRIGQMVLAHPHVKPLPTRASMIQVPLQRELASFIEKYMQDKSLEELLQLKEALNLTGGFAAKNYLDNLFPYPQDLFEIRKAFSDKFEEKLGGKKGAEKMVNDYLKGYDLSLLDARKGEQLYIDQILTDFSSSYGGVDSILTIIDKSIDNDKEVKKAKEEAKKEQLQKSPVPVVSGLGLLKFSELQGAYGKENPFINFLAPFVSGHMATQWEKMLEVNEPKAKLYSHILPIVSAHLSSHQEDFCKQIINKSMTLPDWKDSPIFKRETIESVISDLQSSNKGILLVKRLILIHFARH